MLLRQMKYFLSVADCKSFSEAAEQCYISQSAISQQMKILEDELGTELIKRSNRRFQLTNTGEYFYSKSKEIVRETEELKEKFARWKIARISNSASAVVVAIAFVPCAML